VHKLETEEWEYWLKCIDPNLMTQNGPIKKNGSLKKEIRKNHCGEKKEKRTQIIEQ
jgi:hypothetical protein